MSVKFIKYPFAVAGDKTTVPDATQVDGSVSYQSGFPVDYQLVYGTDANAKAIPRFKFNQVMYDYGTVLNQYQANGFPDFITTLDNGGTPYPYNRFAIVRYDAGGGVLLYRSLVDVNVALPTDITKWAVITDNGLPPGSFVFGGYSGIPAGRLLLCDGTAVSRTSYNLLFDNIGTTWGAGDGISTFNLPDFRRRTPVGAGGTASFGPANTVGSYGGEEGHALTISEMPSHNHPGSTLHWGPVPLQGGGGSYTDVNASGNSETLFIAAQGGNQAHSNFQPSAVVLVCIVY